MKTRYAVVVAILEQRIVEVVRGDARSEVPREEEMLDDVIELGFFDTVEEAEERALQVQQHDLERLQQRQDSGEEEQR